MPLNPTPTSSDTVGRGVLLTLLLHLLQIPMALPWFLLPGSNQLMGFIIPSFIGVSQLVYMIPALILQQRKGRTEVVKGLLIGASITFLLNASCYGLMWATQLIGNG